MKYSYEKVIKTLYGHEEESTIAKYIFESNKL